MDLLLDVLIDSLVDTAKLVPFLFVTYLAMEALEHGMAGRSRGIVARAGAAGPVVGSVLGALPQCGFSAMAATLFSGRVVTMGTLVAVLLSTSDEMIPVFVAHGVASRRMLCLLGMKVVIGAIVGMTIDAALRLLRLSGDGHAHIHELCERAHCHCEGDLGDACDERLAEAIHAAHSHDHGYGCEHDHAGGGLASIARSALVHTWQVSIFILVITFAMGLLIELVGEGAIGGLAGTHPLRAVMVCGLVGMIPNCGASVAITELYLAGTIGPGSMLAGLLTSGGVGLLVLFRTNADMRQNVIVAALLYVAGVACGILAALAGATF